MDKTPTNVLYVTFEGDTIREEAGLIIDTSYNPSHHARQYGTIVLSNPMLEKLGLTKGVQVIFHHFVALESNNETHHKTNYSQFVSDTIGVRSYPCELGQIFAFYDEIEQDWRGVNGWVLAHPILNHETKSAFLDIVGVEKQSDDYIVRVLTKNNICQVNDIVYLTKYCDYIIRMPDGNNAWAFNQNDIIAIKDGEGNRLNAQRGTYKP
jgi:hypothetical protein